MNAIALAAVQCPWGTGDVLNTCWRRRVWMETIRCVDSTQSWRPGQGLTGAASRSTGSEGLENRRKPTRPRQDNRLVRRLTVLANSTLSITARTTGIHTS
eukprot:6492568-Amphidinium_carterae.1